MRGQASLPSALTDKYERLCALLPARYHGMIHSYLGGADITLTPEQAYEATHGLTEFTRSVLTAICSIKRGHTITYGELAAMIGRPTAVRAVASALGRNPLPLVIPCHRVTAAHGQLGGYAFGTDLKEWLLNFEQS